MDTITKAMVFDGQVLVSVIKINDIVNIIKDKLNLSNTAITALGRTMTMGAFIASGLKNEKDKFSITINGGGPLGNIVIAGTSDLRLRGYVSNPQCDVPLKENGKIDVGFAVGKEGNITVIKDMGLKEPYVGVSQLISGEIGEDFAYYYMTSEQQPSAIALGVLIENNKAVGAGGIVIQTMPGCKDHIITVLEDIMTKFTNISSKLKDKEPIEIFNEEFSHFEHKILSEMHPKFECICSEERMKNIIRNLSPNECFEILKVDRKMEIKCHFCNSVYKYTAEEVINIRNNKDNNEL